MPPRHPDRRTTLRAFGSLAAGSLAWPALGAVGGLPSAAHGDSSPQWERIRDSLFGSKPIDSAGAVQLLVPLRAAYGASVPVKVVSRLPQRPELFVQRVVLVVDKNPSPVANTMQLSTDIGQADFETRLRVDEYSHVRVISQLSNGELHMDSRYVKTSGGCSAPPNRDSPHLMGRTQFKLAAPVRLNEPNLAEVTVLHPNDSGFELNQITVMYIPPHFVRSIKVSYASRPLFDAEMDFSVSENPMLRFNFVPRGPGELRAEVMDSREGRFSGALAVGAS